MPKKRADVMALTQHRLMQLGYTRLVGMEFQRGTAKWDMGGVVEAPLFRSDGAPKLAMVPGLWDVEMENQWGVRMAVQVTARSALASRVNKAKGLQDYWNYSGLLEFWGWETIPRFDGGYVVRIVDPKTGRDAIDVLYSTPSLAASEVA